VDPLTATMLYLRKYPLSGRQFLTISVVESTAFLPVVCKSLVRLIGSRKYVGIMLLPALGHADAVICLQSYQCIKSRGS
jgi:hypothetical protein